MRSSETILLVVSISVLSCDTGVIEIDDEPEAQIIRTEYSTDRLEEGYSISEAPNGDLYVAGYGDGRVAVNDGINSRPLFLQIRPDGSIVRFTTIKGIGYGTIWGIKVLENSLYALIHRHDLVDGYKVVNKTRSLYRLDANGDVEAILVENFDSYDRIVNTNGSDILFRVENPQVYGQYFLDNYATDGSLLWTYNMPDGASVGNVFQEPSGNFLVIGRSAENDYRLSNVSSQGNVMWTRKFPKDAAEINGWTAIGATRIAVARMTRDQDYRKHVLIASYSHDGELLWERQYVEGFEIGVHAVEVLPDGDTVFAWSIFQTTSAKTMSEIVRVSDNGEVIWRRSFEPSSDTAIVKDLLVTSDNRLAILGVTGPSGYYYGSDIVVWQMDLD